MKGKKIDTWYPSHEGIVATVVVKFDGMQFEASCEEWKFTERDSDIGKLRQKVEERLAEKASIEWKAMLYVVVAGQDRGVTNGEYRDLKIKVEPMEIGQKANGVFVKRVPHGDEEGMVPPIGDISWFGGHQIAQADASRMHSKNGSAAFILDSQEHRDALDAIITQLANIRSQLEGILSQDNIVENLQRLTKSLASGETLQLNAKSEEA